MPALTEVGKQVIPQQVQAAKLTVLEAPKTPPIPEILERIAWCESRRRHFGDNGKVLRGTYNYYDIGKFQINVHYWGSEAKKRGYDLHSEDGNKAMALVLFERYGTDPWNHSKSCWGSALDK